MSERDVPRLDQLSDAHLADRAAYGDPVAASALLERCGETVWQVAALASGDTATATRATARAFTRTLAAVAAGMTDPTLPVGRALVAAGHELATTARPDDEPDIALPPVVAAADPSARVAAWLAAHEGWSTADAAQVAEVGSLAAEPPTVDDELRSACATLDLPVAAGAVDAALDAWMEWQGVGLTIPEHRPLTTVLGRLDAPLGQLGTVLGRAGTGVASAARRTTRRTTRRRRERRPAPAAVAPAADHLPIGADADDDDAPTGTPAAAPTPVVATGATAASTAITGDLDLPLGDLDRFDLEPIGTTTAIDALLARDVDPSAPDDGFAPFDRPRTRRGPREVVTAGATPTRARVFAALAAGILTASALGSLLTSAPASTGTRTDQVAAGAASPEARSDGNLLDDPLRVEPASATRQADGDAAGPTRTAGDRTGAAGADVGGRASGPPGSPVDRSDQRGRDVNPTGGGASGGSDAGPAAGGSGGGTPALGGGGAGTTPTSGPAPTPTQPAPTPTQPAPAPTTAPPPPATTTPPPPPTTAPPGPVCTLLPILCPGGGLVP